MAEKMLEIFSQLGCDDEFTDLCHRRECKYKQNMTTIMDKYDRDFPDADELDLYSMEVTRDKGHLKTLVPKHKFGKDPGADGPKTTKKESPPSAKVDVNNTSSRAKQFDDLSDDYDDEYEDDEERRVDTSFAKAIEQSFLDLRKELFDKRNEDNDDDDDDDDDVETLSYLSSASHEEDSLVESESGEEDDNQDEMNSEEHTEELEHDMDGRENHQTHHTAVDKTGKLPDERSTLPVQEDRDAEDEDDRTYVEIGTAQPLLANHPVYCRKSANLINNKLINREIQDEAAVNCREDQQEANNALSASGRKEVFRPQPSVSDNTRSLNQLGEKNQKMAKATPNLRTAYVRTSMENHSDFTPVKRGGFSWQKSLVVGEVSDMNAGLFGQKTPVGSKKVKETAPAKVVCNMQQPTALCDLTDDTMGYFERVKASKAQRKANAPKSFQLGTIMSMFNNEKSNETNTLQTYHERSALMNGKLETEKRPLKQRLNQSGTVVVPQPAGQCNVTDQTYCVTVDEDSASLTRPCADLTSKKHDNHDIWNGSESEKKNCSQKHKKTGIHTEYQSRVLPIKHGTHLCETTTTNYEGKRSSQLDQNGLLPPTTRSSISLRSKSLSKWPVYDAVKELTSLKTLFNKSEKPRETENHRTPRKSASVRQVIESIKNSCPPKIVPVSPPKVHRLCNSKGRLTATENAGSQQRVSQSVLPKVLDTERQLDEQHTGTVEACVQTEEMNPPPTINKPAFRWLSLFSQRHKDPVLNSSLRIADDNEVNIEGQAAGVCGSWPQNRIFVQAKRRLTPKKCSPQVAKESLGKHVHNVNARSVDANFQFGLYANKLPHYRGSTLEESDSGLSTNVDTGSSDGGEGRNYQEDCSLCVGSIANTKSLKMAAMQEEAQSSGSSGVFSGSSLSNVSGVVHSETGDAHLSIDRKKCTPRTPDKRCQPLRNRRAAQNTSPYPTANSNFMKRMTCVKRSEEQPRFSSCESQAQCPSQQAVTPSTSLSKLSLNSPHLGQKVTHKNVAVSLPSKFVSPSCSKQRRRVGGNLTSETDIRHLAKKFIDHAKQSECYTKRRTQPAGHIPGSALASSTPCRPSAAPLDISTVSSINDTVSEERMECTLINQSNTSDCSGGNDDSVEVADDLARTLTKSPTVHPRGSQEQGKQKDLWSPLYRKKDIISYHPKKAAPRSKSQATGNVHPPQDMEPSTRSARRTALEPKQPETHTRSRSVKTSRCGTNESRQSRQVRKSAVDCEHHQSPVYSISTQSSSRETVKRPQSQKNTPTKSGKMTNKSCEVVPKASSRISADDFKLQKEKKRTHASRLHYSSSSSPSRSPSPSHLPGQHREKSAITRGSSSPTHLPGQHREKSAITRGSSSPTHLPGQHREKSAITRGSSDRSDSPATRGSDVDPYDIPSDSDETEWYQIYQELEEKTFRHRSKRRSPSRKKHLAKPVFNMGASPAVANALKATEKFAYSGKDTCSELVTLRKEREQEKAGGLVACGLFVETPLSPIGKQTKTLRQNSNTSVRDLGRFSSRSSPLHRHLEGRPARLKHISKGKAFSSEEEEEEEGVTAEVSSSNESTIPGEQSLARNTTSFCLGPDMCTKSFCFSCSACEPD